MYGATSARAHVRKRKASGKIYRPIFDASRKYRRISAAFLLADVSRIQDISDDDDDDDDMWQGASLNSRSFFRSDGNPIAAYARREEFIEIQQLAKF